MGTFTSNVYSAPPLPSAGNCMCPTCYDTLSMGGLPTALKSGWPGYLYGAANNTIQINVANHKTQDICLAAVNLTLSAVRVFPKIEDISPNIASSTAATTVTFVVDYLNPDQDYACFFNGDATPHEATVHNKTYATCNTQANPDSTNPSSISISQAASSKLSASTKAASKAFANTVVLAPSWADPTESYNYPTSFTFYVEPTIKTASPNKGRIGDAISVSGSGFVDSPYMSCKFGDTVVAASYASPSTIECSVPEAMKEVSGGKVQLRVSLNGQDMSSSSVPFSLDTSSGWWTPRHIAILVGSIAGALLLIGVVSAIVIYRRKKSGASHRRGGNSAGYRALPSLSMNSVQSDYDGIDMSEVTLQDKVGRGSFGDIYKAEWRGTEVAVKKIPFNTLNDDLVQEMLNEARIMESIRHPNVLSLMGCCPRPPEVCIIMEYMPRGSLYAILQDSRIPLSWQLIQRMALDAARGMNFLHQHNPIIMHRDLKSHNLLVDDAWRVKVADFGLSRMIEEHVSATMTVCGTPCWTAPEVLRNQRYSTKADVYSFGICLWELYTRTAPYAGMTPFQVMYGVASSSMRPPINDDCPEPWRELMITCWSESPDDRPTFDVIAKTLQNMVLPETGGFH